MLVTSIGSPARRLRACLLATSALIALPSAAQAAAGGDPAVPDGGGTTPSIVISQPGTPTTAIDTQDVNGVGQMVIDQKNGFLGLCTGTLINPRTVILAAHCVNESPTGTAMNPWNYGTGAGQLPIGFGFKANNLAGIRSWYLTGANQYKTNTANAFYNVNQVVYNPDSLKLGLANNFLQGDVALATFDTPARNVPTWTILLSALPAPATISDTTGTGYHVTITGYGTNGIGTTGATGGIDYRRRVAENFVGLLGSLDDLDLFLFGHRDGLPQNLYQLDFDDPRRGTNAASPYDFNPFKDKALPNEGITGPGDSGGPLILDKTFSKKTVIGVLSGGDRFYNAQVSGSYGTTSFYQPLYLFWDYIAANNPYRYVSALAGDGAWIDPTHWVTNLDPAYQVIVNGQLVNGVPGAPGAGIAGADPNKFGQICFDTRTVSDCYDVHTNVETVKPVSSGGGDGQGNGTTATAAVTTPATARADGMIVARSAQNASVDAGSIGQADGAALAASTDAGSASDTATLTTAALPPATLANGLPGATNFVPSNIDPNAATQRSARYYDVTLSAAGTTTLSSAVTIDRFTITNAARLNVASTGALTSLIDVTQTGGVVQVDGALTTRGDYFLMTGGLTGSGRITTPFFTNAVGMIAPGTLGGIGTLGFNGNVILTSGSTLLVDLGAGGASDRIAVNATSFAANGTTPLDGLANVGGRVGFSPVAGYTIRSNDLFTIVTAQGGVTGTFQTATPLSAILTPTYIYTPQAVQVRIAAGLYANVVQPTPVQTAYARLLDQNRATNYATLSGLYGTLDLQSAGTIQNTLENLAPRTETLVRSLGTVAVDNMSRLFRDHLAGMDVRHGLGGTLTTIGQPLQVASLLATDLPGQAPVGSDAVTAVRPGVLPEDMSGFVAGGYLDGNARPMPGVAYLGRDTFDGYFFAGGLEKQVDDRSAIGFGLSYTRTDGRTGAAGQSARGELIQGTLYGKLEIAGGLGLDTQFAAGQFAVHTDRAASVAGNGFRLTSRDRALVVTSEVGLSQSFTLADTFRFAPRIAARASHVGYTPTAERGGDPALFYDRQAVNSVEGRVGAVLSGGVRIKPYAAAYYVHGFEGRPNAVGVNFAGGVGPNALFALAGRDRDWFETSAGLSIDTARVTLSIGADTTIDRRDVENQAYRGSISLRF